MGLPRRTSAELGNGAQFISQQESGGWSIQHDYSPGRPAAVATAPGGPRAPRSLALAGLTADLSSSARLDIPGSAPCWKLPGRKHVAPPPPLHKLSASLVVQAQVRGWDLWGTGRRGPVSTHREASVWHGWAHGQWDPDRRGEPDLNAVMRRRILYRVKEPRKEGKKMVMPAPGTTPEGLALHGREAELLPAPTKSWPRSPSLAEGLSPEPHGHAPHHHHGGGHGHEGGGGGRVARLAAQGVPPRRSRPENVYDGTMTQDEYEHITGRGIVRVEDPRGGLPVVAGGDKPYKAVEHSPGWKPLLTSEYSLDFDRTVQTEQRIADGTDAKPPGARLQLPKLPVGPVRVVRLPGDRPATTASASGARRAARHEAELLVRGLENWAPAARG